jgi:hypothetical protein
MSRRALGGWLVGSMLVAVPSLLSAQERGHVAGVYGWTFGDETASLYGGQVGVAVSENFQIVGGVERLQNVLTGRFATLLNDISSLPGVDVQGEVPATYGGGGVRFVFPGMTASPYLQAELGATQVDTTGLRLRVDGNDITGDLETDLLEKSTNFTFIAAAGVRFDIGESFLAEATFKFFDIMGDKDELNLNRINFAFGVRF